MSERNDMLERLRDVIAHQLESDVPDVLNEEDRLYEDLHLDSIVVLQLMVYIEELFEVVIPEEDVDPGVFQTTGSLISFIQQLQRMKVQP